MYLGLTYGPYLHLKKEIKTLASLSPFRLIRYADGNYAGNPKDKK